MKTYYFKSITKNEKKIFKSFSRLSEYINAYEFKLGEQYEYTNANGDIITGYAFKIKEGN